MKQKISVSIEEDKIKKITDFVRKGVFRSKSHAVESGVDAIIKSIGETIK